MLSLSPTMLPTVTTPMVLAVPLLMLMLTPTPMPVTMPMVSVLDTDRLADVRASGLGDPFGPGYPLQSPVAALPAISTSIPIASNRFAHSALRLASRRQRRAAVPDTVPGFNRSALAPALRAALAAPRCTSRVAGAGFARHRALHRAPHLRPHHCGRHCRRLRQRAARDCLRHCPQCPPLKRRGGSTARPAPVSISPSLIPQIGRSGPPGRPWVSHPTHRRCRACHRALCPAFSGSFRVKRGPEIVGPSVCSGKGFLTL